MWTVIRTRHVHHDCNSLSGVIQTRAIWQGYLTDGVKAAVCSWRMALSNTPAACYRVGRGTIAWLDGLAWSDQPVIV
jgi:hypothetical protein